MTLIKRNIVVQFTIFLKLSVYLDINYYEISNKSYVSKGIIWNTRECSHIRRKM